jgi:hypothetical protein
MSQENVEIVRRAHDALNSGNLDELMTLCHRDFQLNMSDRVLNPLPAKGTTDSGCSNPAFRKSGSATSGNWKNSMTRETLWSPCCVQKAEDGEASSRSTARRR